MPLFKMHRVHVPVNRGKEKKIRCPGYLEQNFIKMAGKTAHLSKVNPQKLITSQSGITTTQLEGHSERR